ncbi:MAG: cell wall-binding repeat-containing protein, partial [Lachnospiraceae bacterium]|nr:cell wall-binding repeat-containing protein [Candidatus Equihabitans merdae]
MIKTFFKKMLLTLSAAVIIAAGCGISAEPVHAATVGLNVASHSKEEIVQYIVNNNVKLNDPITYDVEPVFTAPYVNGRLSDETMDSAIKMLNNARYVAGLQSVTHNSAWDEMMMAATLVNKANNVLTHTPSQPAGMSDSLYQLGYSGCSSANIGMGHSTLNQDIIQGWLADSGDNNLATMGHRRWCLNPTMGATSFGAAGTAWPRYMAMYAFDRSNSSARESRVAWPAQVMPLQYFGDNYPWTISMGSSVTMANINVTLTRRSDNQTWHFSSASADGYFNVNNGGYGQTGCITFRPDSISYADGDVFDVTITGMTDTVKYTVNFFDLDKDFHTHEYSTSGISINQVNPGLTISYVCQCGDKYTKFFPSTLISVTTPATCTTSGRGGYECPTDSGTYSYSGTIPALGHDWDGGVITKEATCGADGEKTISCSRCDATKTEVIKASSDKHKVENVPAVPATCEKGGTTAGTKCSVCGQILSGCTATNALGHAWNSGVVTTAATCTSDGVKTFTCTRCNGTKTEAIKATGHTWNSGVITTAATCTSNGVKTFTCTKCNDTKTETINATGHKSQNVAAVAATCEKGGTTAGTKCSVCGQILTGCTATNALGHAWNSGVITTAATCTSDGVKTYTCTRCNATKTEAVKATGHTWNSGVVTTAATCASDGVKTYTCTKCNATRTENIKASGHTVVDMPEVPATCDKSGKAAGTKCSVCGLVLSGGTTIPALGHDWSSSVVIKEATCTTDGQRKNICSRCQTTITATIKATGHKSENVAAVAATCEKGGTTAGTKCSVCGQILSGCTATSALGHAWNSGVVTTAATCTNDGVKTFTCTRCNGTRTEAIKATGHKSVSVGAVAATCEKDGTTAGTKCSVCNQILSGCTTIKALGHAWNGGEITKEAACEADGEKKISCTRCDAYKTEVIKALGHDWDEGVVTTEPTYDSEGVKTFSCSRCDATRTETIPCLKKDDRDFITRLAGAGRVDTSLQAADEYKDLMGMDKFDTVILANAYNFPDALGGSYLAAVKEAPMLLVDAGDIMLTANYVINN